MISIPNLRKMYTCALLHGLPSYMGLYSHGARQFVELGPCVTHLTCQAVYRCYMPKQLGSPEIIFEAYIFHKTGMEIIFSRVLRCRNIMYIFHIIEKMSKTRRTFFTFLNKMSKKFNRGRRVRLSISQNYRFVNEFFQHLLKFCFHYLNLTLNGPSVDQIWLRDTIHNADPLLILCPRPLIFDMV